MLSNNVIKVLGINFQSRFSPRNTTPLFPQQPEQFLNLNLNS
jgi:hypothetical protein